MESLVSFSTHYLPAAQFISSIITAASFFITAGTFILSVLALRKELNKRRKEREYGTYNSLDDKYIEYLKLCIDHPRLDTYSANHDSSTLNEVEKQQRFAMFNILISICERSFLMYSDQSSKIKAAQWSGWRDFIVTWSKNSGFKELWRDNSPQYDKGFTKFVNTEVLSDAL